MSGVLLFQPMADEFVERGAVAAMRLQPADLPEIGLLEIGQEHSASKSTMVMELELIALASLLPWCLSLLLAYHVAAVTQAFVLMGQLG